MMILYDNIVAKFKITALLSYDRKALWIFFLQTAPKCIKTLEGFRI